MRILYFHQYFKTRSGSGGTRSYEFAKHLVSKGHQVTVVYALSNNSKSILDGAYKNGIRRGVFEGINLIELDLYYSSKLNFLNRSLVFLKYSLRSIKLVFTEKYDLIFATSTPLTAGIPGIIMKLFRKKKFVFEVRDLWPELPREMGVIKNRMVLSLMGFLEWLSYRMADACIGLSPGIVNGIKKRRKRKGDVAMIPNASDIDLFYPKEQNKDIIPGCDSSDFVAIFTGSHGIANGLNSVIDAAKEVHDRNITNIKFLFVGDGMEKEAIKRKVENLNLKNCIFIDPVSKEKLLQYLNASDLGLMILANIPAFYYGTSPNKFFDYLAAGLPILVNYPGWMSDIVNANKCGISVEPDNPKDFAEKIIHIYNRKSELDVMRKNARRVAENDFNRQKLCEEFEAFLSSV